jgi:hypothetical protein
VQHGSPQPISARLFVSMNLMARSMFDEKELATNQFLPLLRRNKLWQVMTKDIMDYLSWKHHLLESLRPFPVTVTVLFQMH